MRMNKKNLKQISWRQLPNGNRCDCESRERAKFVQTRTDSVYGRLAANAHRGAHNQNLLNEKMKEHPNHTLVWRKLSNRIFKILFSLLCREGPQNDNLFTSLGSLWMVSIGFHDEILAQKWFLNFQLEKLAQELGAFVFGQRAFGERFRYDLPYNNSTGSYCWILPLNSTAEFHSWIPLSELY